MSYVALIAGQGAMPIKIIQELKASGKKVLLLGIRGVTPESLTENVDKVIWGGIARLGKARSACLKYHVKEAIMAGLIRHNNVFSLSFLTMDWVTLKAFLSLRDLRADTICSKVIEIFQKKGISFINTTEILKRYLAPEGTLTTKKPTKKMLEEVEFGLKLAKELGRLDIGQCIIVKNKSVVAVEAMEGTDQCIQRAGDIAGKGCVVIKLSKPMQDSRFDVPVIGINTIEKLVKIKAEVIAIEADKTLIIDNEVIELANQNGIVILSMSLK
jgi:UDP-2,3-diacylglucosamine hydrolase